MNKLFLSSAVALFLLAPAHAQSVGEKTGVNSALGISPTTQDFVTEAANSDMMEIAAAKLAQEKGNADEKKFAEQMITDHTKTTNDIKGDGGERRRQGRDSGEPRFLASIEARQAARRQGRTISPATTTRCR